MLANKWSPPPLCLFALEATEPAEEAIKRSIMSYKLNKTLGRAWDPRANGAWLSKLTERNMKCLS